MPWGLVVDPFADLGPEKPYLKILRALTQARERNVRFYAFFPGNTPSRWGWSLFGETLATSSG